MQHLKDLTFTVVMMLIFSGCTVSLNYYSILYIAHSIMSIPLTCFHNIEL